MILGRVVGNVWATRKKEELSGLKLLIVQRLDALSGDPLENFVAVDCVGAGAGEKVLVAFGSSARKALDVSESPVDASIVGIIDEAKE